MKNLNLHPIKKLEIILAGEHQSFATDLLDRAGVKGYTIVNNLSGKGSHGFHAGHVMFNEDDALIMIIAAVASELVSPILEGLAPFYNDNSGVVFVSDIEVTRVVKFTDESEKSDKVNKPDSSKKADKSDKSEDSKEPAKKDDKAQPSKNKAEPSKSSEDPKKDSKK